MAHIDGTAPNEREAHESAEEEEQPQPLYGDNGLTSVNEGSEGGLNDMISEREEGEECSDAGTEKVEDQQTVNENENDAENGTLTTICSNAPGAARLGNAGGSGLLDMFSQSLMNTNDMNSSAERLAALSKISDEPRSKFKRLGEPPEPVPEPVLPASCYLTMSKNVLIEELLAKYYMTWHPFPKLFGELLVFKPRSVDQSDEEKIVYREYTLCNRLPMRK